MVVRPLRSGFLPSISIYCIKHVSLALLSVGSRPQVPLSPFPHFLSLLPLCSGRPSRSVSPRTAPGCGSGNAAGSSSPAIASSITRVSALAGVGWTGPPPQPPPFPLGSWPPDPCVIPDPSPSSADSREESVLGSVLLPSYSIRPDGPGALRGRRFTFTVSGH